MNYRITVVCENCVGPMSGTLGEHGFSALIEPSRGDSILFDTGQGATLLHNSRKMNKNLAAVGSVVLSHGHYDHCGGLLPLLKEYGSRQVYAHPSIFKPRFRIKDTGDVYPIGIPHSQQELEAAGALFEMSREFRSLAPGIFLSGEVPRSTNFETGDSGLYCDTAAREKDITEDDQSLIIETQRGLVIVLGCCHAGIINTLEHVTQKIGRRDVHAVIGGTHLGFCGQKQLDMTISSLKGWGIQKLSASHCTGFAASARLWTEMAKEFQVAHVGYTLEV